MGEVAYFPPNGTFNLMYFPYYGKKAQVHPNMEKLGYKQVRKAQNNNM